MKSVRRSDGLPGVDASAFKGWPEITVASLRTICVENGSGGLLIGRLAQMRYWSATQARLLAQRIAWAHIELLKGHADA